MQQRAIGGLENKSIQFLVKIVLKKGFLLLFIVFYLVLGHAFWYNWNDKECVINIKKVLNVGGKKIE